MEYFFPLLDIIKTFLPDDEEDERNGNKESSSKDNTADVEEEENKGKADECNKGVNTSQPPLDLPSTSYFQGENLIEEVLRNENTFNITAESSSKDNTADVEEEEDKGKADECNKGVNTSQPHLDLPSTSYFQGENLIEEVLRNENTFNITAGLKMMEVMMKLAEESSMPFHGMVGGLSLPEDKQHEVEERSKAIEKGSRLVEKRLKEIQVERANLTELLDKVREVSARVASAQLAGRIAESELPDIQDIRLLDLLTRELRLAEEQEHLLAELERKRRVMENVMNEAENMLLTAPWFRWDDMQSNIKPRKKLKFKTTVEMKSFKQSEEANKIHLSESETIPTFRDYGINKLSLLRKEEEAIPNMSTLGMLSEKAKNMLSEVDKEYERSLDEEEEEHKTSSHENKPEINTKKEERNSNVLNSEEGNSNLLHSEEKTQAAKSTEEVLEEPRRKTDSGKEMIDNNSTERITETLIKAEEVSNLQEEGVSPTNLSEIDQMWPTSSTTLTDTHSTNQDK